MYLTNSIWLRMFGLAFLYTAQGVPIGLFTIALPAWLAANGADASEVASLIAITGLPWGFKLISGPFMDRFSFPAMGRRRPWVMAAQTGLTLSVLSLAIVTDPAEQIWTLTVLGFVINSFAAVQDVAVDGMAIDILPPDERGRANAFMAFGQTVGFSGFGALNGYLLTQVGLQTTALVSGIAVAAVLGFATLIRERPGERLLPWTPGAATKRQDLPSKSFLVIFKELAQVLLLPMSLILIGVEVLARMGAGIYISVLPVMATQEMGFSSEQYAYWMGIMGATAAAAGIGFGPIIDRYGAAKLLSVALLGSAVVAVSFAVATSMWTDATFVVYMLGISQILSQALFIAVIAIFMGICWSKVAATQFAVYMSLANLARSAGAALVAMIAADVSSVQLIYLMAGFFVAAFVLLQFFAPEPHEARLAELAEQTDLQGSALDA